MIVERTAVVPLSPDETWEAFFGNEMQNWCDLSDVVVEIRDYQMRPDGTPEYVMVNRMGPMRTSHRSDYAIFNPPLGRRATRHHEVPLPAHASGFQETVSSGS